MSGRARQIPFEARLFEYETSHQDQFRLMYSNYTIIGTVGFNLTLDRNISPNVGLSPAESPGWGPYILTRSNFNFCL